MVFKIFCEDSRAPAFVTDWISKVYPEGSEKAKRFLNCSSALLTWNGDWGVLENVPEGLSGESMDTLCCHVRKLAEAKSIWEDFLEHIERLVEKYHLPAWGACAELCGKTYNETGKFRVHTHFFFKAPGAVQMYSAEPLSFRASTPHKVPGSIVGRGRGKMAFQGLYYTVAPKIGSLWTHSNCISHVDFQVNPDWPMQLACAGKMHVPVARQEIIRTGRCLVRKIADFDRWVDLTEEMSLQQEIDDLQSYLRTTNSPFRSYEEVTSWLEECGRRKSRKRFLVIEGRSGLGKSEYVRSLFPSGSVLELNCAALKDICLRGFKSQVHRCIFWDECKPQLVVENRKVFQCPAVWIDLGHSGTGQYVYKVWLAGAVMIIAANGWTSQVDSMTCKDDRDWLHANAKVLEVKEPMWLSAQVAKAKQSS